MSQIDRQIEENVAVSSMENLQLSCPGLVHSENLVDDYRVVENGIPDLSIISEENSHIPTDMCTSVSVPFFLRNFPQRLPQQQKRFPGDL